MKVSELKQVWSKADRINRLLNDIIGDKKWNLQKINYKKLL